MILKKASNVVVFIIITAFAAFFSGCSPDPAKLITDADLARIDSAITATSWSVPDFPEKALRPRTWDMQHKKLWLRFDFDNQKVLGKTELFLTSMRSNNARLILDSKTARIDSVYILQTGEKLDYQKDSLTVTIQLPRFFARNDSLYIGMSFVSEPKNRGLYFVNPQGRDPVKPVQIWTLGQPEDNSYWLPTIDHPAERMTQELWISVPEQFETVSNGILIEQITHAGDSLRTDYWRLDKPHAPYLLALAVGEFSLTETFRNDIIFRYYTEPKFRDYVDIIYEHTETMMSFMEQYTGVAYPWGNVYAQVPVRDFIAAGMEHTTASFLFDGVQFDYRGAVDLSNQDLIMHELAHQWFGNLVTNQDWANLPLNEGFAMYFEILFRDYLQGADEAAWANINQQEDYFREAQLLRRPVISARYNSPDDIFDAHTYQKSSQILRMLHHLVGDDIWKSAINAYLTDFAFQSVSIEDLQQIFERESGRQLGWFFDQWFLQPGHPTLSVQPEERGNAFSLRINQNQQTDVQPLFRMFSDVEFHFENGNSATQTIEINRKDSLYVFDIDDVVSDVILDPKGILHADIQPYGTKEQLFSRLDNNSVFVRYQTLNFLSDFVLNEEMQSAPIILAEHDSFWGIRLMAVEMLARYTDERTEKFALSRNYESEKEGQVRLASLYLLDDFDNPEVKQHLKTMTADTSYFVAAEAIKMYGYMYPETSYDVISKFAEQDSWADVIKTSVVMGLSESYDIRAFELFAQLALHPGDAEYIRLAMEQLTNYYPERDTRAEAIEVYIAKLTDPYIQNRFVAYEGLSMLQANEAVEVLRQSKHLVSERERQLIQQIIDEIQGIEQDTE